MVWRKLDQVIFVARSHSDVLCEKVCSENFCKIRRKISVPESLCNIESTNSLKKRLWHSLFSVNFSKISRKTFIQYRTSVTGCFFFCNKTKFELPRNYIRIQYNFLELQNEKKFLQLRSSQVVAIASFW